jgi:DNA primase
VHLEKRAFHCFGCGARGNVLDFVARMEDAELPEAAARLAEICAIPLSEVSREQNDSKSGRTRAVQPHRKPQETRKPATARKLPRQHKRRSLGLLARQRQLLVRCLSSSCSRGVAAH